MANTSNAQDASGAEPEGCAKCVRYAYFESAESLLVCSGDCTTDSHGEVVRCDADWGVLRQTSTHATTEQVG